MAVDAIVVAGGPEPLVDPAVLPSAGLVIGADHGFDHARAMGLEPSRAVGDFDSISDLGLWRAEHAPTSPIRYPTDKDHTDLELAIDHAVAHGCERIHVVASGAGRADHVLAIWMMLAGPRFSAQRITAHLDSTYVAVVRDEVEIEGEVGDCVSLFAVTEVADGVETSGLRWRLDGEALEPGSCRGLSNEMTARSASISVSSGSLVVVQPA